MYMNKSIFISAIALFLPVCVYAGGSSATIEAPTRPVRVGDTILVPVMLSIPEVDGINALQARVTVSGSAHLKSVSNGGSVFTLWPETTVANDTVTFTGGTQGSVYGSPLRAITLVISASTVGKAEIALTGATAYAEDGKGTPRPLKDTTISFPIKAKASASRDEFQMLVSKDTAAPEPFSIALGRDDSFAGGAYFISFSTDDTDSGVSHYEVQEGTGAWTSVTDGVYVLQDQTLSLPVNVRAIDAAQNVRTESVVFKRNPQHTLTLAWWIGGGFALVTLLFFWRRKRRIKREIQRHET